MRKPDALTTKMMQVNDKKNLVNRPAFEKEVAKYSRSGAKEANSIFLLIRRR